MSRLWEVVGGEAAGGILVRTGRDLGSALEERRLCTGAVVEEEELVGQRLRYRRLSGAGPDRGWVSLSIRDKSLVVRANQPNITVCACHDAADEGSSRGTVGETCGAAARDASTCSSGHPVKRHGGRLVIDNAHFKARLSLGNTCMIIQCLAPAGHVLCTVDDDRQFELVVGLARGAADSVVAQLRAAADLKFQEWFVVDEPYAITILRSALLCSISLSPFRSIAECISEYWDAMNVELRTTADEYAEGMRCHEVLPGIFQVEFNHQLLMASTMLRFQERYECPCDGLRGRNFSLAEYKAWERGNERGFRYYDTWSGFNVPCDIVHAVLEDTDSLLPRERAFQQVIAPALSVRRFYVVGTCGSVGLPHELSHGLYEMRPDYRAEVDQALAVIPPMLKRQMEQDLVGRGYARVERILRDEIHAYLLEGHCLGCHLAQTALHTRRLRSIFHNHAGDLGWHLLPG